MGGHIGHKVQEWEGGWSPTNTTPTNEEEMQFLWNPLRENLMEIIKSLEAPANLAVIERFESGTQQAKNLKQVQSMAKSCIGGFQKKAEAIALKECKDLNKKWNSHLCQKPEGSPLAAIRIKIFAEFQYRVLAGKSTKVSLKTCLNVRRIVGQGPGRKHWCERVVTHVLAWQPDWIDTLDCSSDSDNKSVKSRRSGSTRKTALLAAVSSSKSTMEASRSYLETLFSLEPSADSDSTTYTVS